MPAPARLALRLVLVTGVLAGCGLKGPLTLPERSSGEVVIRDPATPVPSPAPAEPTPPGPAPPGSTEPRADPTP